MENPTCPATILHPKVHDAYGGADAKRDLVSEAQQHEILHGRATDCTAANWEKLLTYAALMFSMSQVGFNSVRSIWDDDFAGHYDSELNFAQIQDYLYDYPWLDTRALLEYVLLNPFSAGGGLRMARRTGSLLCKRLGSTKRELTLGSLDAEEVTKRIVWPEAADASGTPGLLTILEGIRDGFLSLHYARWQWYRGARSGALPGPLLELAYWIGPQPGVATTNNPTYDEYRDMTPRDSESNADRWVGK
jgi:chitinase